MHIKKEARWTGRGTVELCASGYERRHCKLLITTAKVAAMKGKVLKLIRYCCGLGSEIQ